MAILLNYTVKLEAEMDQRTFVLRAWREPEAGEPGSWRMRVEDVESGDVRAFDGLAALQAFLTTAFEEATG